MKDPYVLTEIELEALWEFGATKAEVRDRQADERRLAQRQRDAERVVDYRQRHPEATCRDAIALVLADMEAALKKLPVAAA